MQFLLVAGDLSSSQNAEKKLFLVLCCLELLVPWDFFGSQNSVKFIYCIVSFSKSKLISSFYIFQIHHYACFKQDFLLKSLFLVSMLAERFPGSYVVNYIMVQSRMRRVNLQEWSKDKQSAENESCASWEYEMIVLSIVRRIVCIFCMCIKGAVWKNKHQVLSTPAWVVTSRSFVVVVCINLYKSMNSFFVPIAATCWYRFKGCT